MIVRRTASIISDYIDHLKKGSLSSCSARPTLEQPRVTTT